VDTKYGIITGVKQQRYWIISQDDWFKV